MDPLNFGKAEQAGLAIENQTVRDLTTQVLPVLKETATAVISGAMSTLQETVGGSLKDLTFERTELVNDIHGILDRLNGTRVLLTAGGMQLQIPERK
jgi:hypothetical protein